MQYIIIIIIFYKDSLTWKWYSDVDIMTVWLYLEGQVTWILYVKFEFHSFSVLTVVIMA
jgi:hypothetical protein